MCSAALLAVIAAAAAGARFGLLMVTVRGISMEPTLREGQRVLAARRQVVRPLRVGDIVVCHPPPLPGQPPPGPGVPNHGPAVVKRIAAVGGQTVTAGGVIREVPAGHYWVRGDGAHTYDSDHYGALAERSLVALMVGRPRSPGPGG
ncbi:S24/S26 family peptidase [Catellatospora citrea]|uniref:S24/S26 family peptidase n=1 Tax=Catellatospora citrea TaxID=53366 RepID=UPI0033FBBB5F